MVNTWKVVLATVVIFAAGVLTGGLTARLQHRAEERLRPGADAWMLPRLEFLRRAQRELDLTDEQRRQIEAIFRESRERMRPVWQQALPEMRAELARVREQMREVLTPRQRDQFERLLQDRGSRRRFEPVGRPLREREDRATPAPARERPARPDGQ